MRILKYAPLFLISPLLMAQSIDVTLSHETAVYKVGESAAITILVKDQDGNALKRGSAKVTIDNFSSNAITNAVLDFAIANPVTLHVTQDEPGFLFCSATAKVNDKDLQHRCGIGFSPELIKTGSDRPTDFDTFWESAVAKLNQEVPVDAQLERLENFCTDKYESFRISFATANKQRIYGFLSVPAGNGPFPVRVSVPGAGPGSCGPNTGAASRGVISLTMNVHPFQPAVNKDEQKQLYDEQNEKFKQEYDVSRYCYSGAQSCETYFFYAAILGINRAVNWLAARPDVDLKAFSYWGSSQGGGFGLYLCGLNKHFTAAVSHVPALTDLSGFQRQRASGWPKLVENVPEKDKQAATRIAPYFDAAHFAPRITCPIVVTVGFIDRTCPPAAVYAGYNAIASQDKTIIHGLLMPHSIRPEVSKPTNEWLKQRKVAE